MHAKPDKNCPFFVELIRENGSASKLCCFHRPLLLWKDDSQEIMSTSLWAVFMWEFTLHRAPPTVKGELGKGGNDKYSRSLSVAMVTILAVIISSRGSRNIVEVVKAFDSDWNWAAEIFVSFTQRERERERGGDWEKKVQCQQKVSTIFYASPTR